MQYEAKNYALLEQVHQNLVMFLNSTRLTTPLNFEVILNAYKPHSDVEVDEVANAICWCINTLHGLVVGSPIRNLDEVLSFTTSVLERRETL